MNRINAASAGLLLLTAPIPDSLAAAVPSGADVCLNTRDIARTHILNDKTILFHMRDGKVWRNDLRTACPMLTTSPYTERLTTDLICANQQSIHLTLTGDDCALGSFTRVVPPR